MAKHRFRLTIEYDGPITGELMEIWREDALRWEGVVSAKVTDASLSDEDLERLRGQAGKARETAIPPWMRKPVGVGTDGKRRSVPVCQIPGCGCTGEAHL